LLFDLGVGLGAFADVLGHALTLHRHAHGACGPFDDAHGGLDAGGIQVRHLGLGDLLDLVLGDLADLLLVGDARARLDLGGLLDEDAGGAGLDLELEGAVAVDGDDAADDLMNWPGFTPLEPRTGPSGGAGVADPPGAMILKT
jgi:hypothetical protein